MITITKFRQPRHPTSSLGLALASVLLPCIATRSGTNGDLPISAGTGDTNRAPVPGLYDPNGRATSKGSRFTTKAYNQEALRLVIEEANKAAKDLRLPEELPITEDKLTHSFILGYGQSLAHRGAIGNVRTRDWWYFVSLDHKLCCLGGAHYDRDCQKWLDESQLPRNQVDTNGAFQLATQWLAAAGMDVAALNHECSVKAMPDPSWNKRVMNSDKFVPIYNVWWMPVKSVPERGGAVASVTLFLP